MALHSRYNPQAEAHRFVDAISVPLPPDYLVITEPGESYLAKPLRERFPHSVLIAVRYTDSLFLSTDAAWDYVYRPVNGSLPRFLLNTVPDEFFANTIFLSWKPADNQWPDCANSVHKAISETLEIFKSVMYTRTAFGSLWLKNFVTNLALIKNPAAAEFTDADFFFLASGFSAETQWKLLLQKKAPCLCAGSTYEAARYYHIPVSACISTDGSFWAGQHLRNLEKTVPLLFPLEAGIPKPLLEKNFGVLLSYGSELERYVFDELHVPFLSAKRNGTVSGTAVELLLEYTAKSIYAFGLDLHGGKSFSHARPHLSLNRVQSCTTKLRSLETVLCTPRFASASLQTYAAWFASLPPYKARRLFRTGLDSGCAVLRNVMSVPSDAVAEKKFADWKNAVRIVPITCSESVERKAFLCRFIHDASEQINVMPLHDILYPAGKKSKRLKEMVELTAYAKLVRYVKTKSSADAQAVKEKCRAELEILLERVGKL
ncbi:MAG: hypothetical protein P1P63_03940 [Treponemataceae bacterium]